MISSRDMLTLSDILPRKIEKTCNNQYLAGEMGTSSIEHGATKASKNVRNKRKMRKNATTPRDSWMREWGRRTEVSKERGRRETLRNERARAGEARYSVNRDASICEASRYSSSASSALSCATSCALSDFDGGSSVTLLFLLRFHFDFVLALRQFV